MKKLIPLKCFLLAMPIVGYVISYYFHNSIQKSVNSNEPDFTTLSYEVHSFISSYGMILAIFLLSFGALTRLLFSTSATITPTAVLTSDADKALLHGLTLIMFGMLIYLAIYLFSQPI